MRNEPALTLQGALEILGRRERRVLDRLSKGLGGVILGAGMLAAVHAAGSAGLWAAIWGWTEQKNTAIELVRAAGDWVSGRRADSKGRERRQVIAAAHTTIVVAAFFEGFEEQVGKDFYACLELTEAEKARLLTGRKADEGEALIDRLYAAEIPRRRPRAGSRRTSTGSARG